MVKDSTGKPVIRHCENCKWCEITMNCHFSCSVRHEKVFRRRLRALFCRFYKAKLK